MSVDLLTEEQLAGFDGALSDYMSRDRSIRWEDLDPRSRQAYGRYTLFAQRHLQETMGLKHLHPLIAFYNAYHWIVVFSKRYQQHFGSDAGVEQQVFKVLESAPSGVDWEVVEKIAKGASA